MTLKQLACIVLHRRRKQPSAIECHASPPPHPRSSKLLQFKHCNYQKSVLNRLNQDGQQKKKQKYKQQMHNLSVFTCVNFSVFLYTNCVLAQARSELRFWRGAELGKVKNPKQIYTIIFWEKQENWSVFHNTCKKVEFC